MAEQHSSHTLRAQHRHRQPGRQPEMAPAPQREPAGCAGSDRWAGRLAIGTGGDSGIDRAVALAFAPEGADSVIAWETVDD